MKRSFWSTIRGKLVIRTLLVVMIPVLVLGGVAVAAMMSITRSADESVSAARVQLGDDVIGEGAAHNAVMVASDVAEFLNERISDTLGWSRSSVILDGARSGAAKAESLGLDELTIEEIEAQFSSDRQLGHPRAADELGIFLSNSPDFKEVFFTDRNGYNVAISGPTSDMVQSDEEWWQHAWEFGIHIDEPEFDESAGVFSVDISVRLDDADTPVGVMKSSLDLQTVQQAAGHTMAGMADGDTMAGIADGDEMADMAGFAGFDVTIVAANKLLLAETSTGNSSDRIMNPDLEIGDDANPRLAILAASDEAMLADHPDGYSLTDDWVAGYAHVLNSFNNINESDRINADDVGALDWTVVVQQPTAEAYTSLVPLETLNDELASTSSLLILVLVGVAVLALTIAVGSSLTFSRRITIPIRKLRDAAVHAADVALPAVVAQIDEIGPDDEVPSLDPVQITTGDEVEDLAHSFNTVQQTAVDLAAQQARLRRQHVATTFVSMGRRNQNLLSKQLEHINAMEQNESDSETLRHLFQLDHLATRMRRNAESLLVLAGEETPRRFRAPVSIRQLIQAAGGEIEEFDRIDMGRIDEAAIEGGVASDIARLLAELLENASRFSPPTTEIQIHGRRRVDGGYVLSLIDEGLGMEGNDLVTANKRLSDPVEFDRAPSAYLGLFVVGHLARRHGLAVRLSESTFGGITATVEIPAELLVASPMPSRPEPVAAGYGEELLDEEPGYVPELVPASAYESEAAHRADDGGSQPVSDLPAEPLAEWLPMPDPWLDATSETVPETMPAPWLDATSESVPEAMPDPWFDAPPKSLTDPWLDLPRAVESEPVPDPWSEVDRQPTSAEADADSPVEAPVEATADATTAPEPMPGMPLTTTMPIAIPMADPDPIGASDQIVAADPIGASDEVVAPAPLPRWGRDPEMDRLSEVPPAPPPPPEEIHELASYASSLAFEPPTPPQPPLPPPPPRSTGSSPAADPVGELTPSGFRRRKRGHEGAPAAVSPAQSDEAPSEPPHRDAGTVQASLARFRAGVTQGRAAVGDGDDPSGADDRDER